MYLGKLVEVGPAEVVRGRRTRTPGADRHRAVRRPEAAGARARVAIRGELPSAMNPPTGCRFRTRCPLAQDICETEPPLAGDGHQVACHFPLRPESTAASARPGAAAAA